MKKRVQKKRWKEQTTAQQSDLLERVAALEELTLLMTAEQTTQRERVEEVTDGLILFREVHTKHHEAEAARRIRRYRIRLEREMERRRKRKEWARLGALATFAVAFLCFALVFPAYEPMEPVGATTSEAVAVNPAEGMIEVMALRWDNG